MFLKSLLKMNPFLMIGIIFFLLFLALYGQKFAAKMGWTSYADRLNSTSCRSVMVVLKKNLPANWAAGCHKNNLEVSINYPAKADVKLPTKNLCILMYKEMANYLRTLADSSVTPTKYLEETDIVALKIKHPQMGLNAVTEGQFLAKLSTMTNPKLLAEHLKVTVQVQEVPPTCQVEEKEKK